MPTDAKRSSQATPDTRRPPAAGVAGAYFFFAALYFVQSVGDPISGLIAQPVRSLLKSWGESPAALGVLMALLAVPWTIKPTTVFATVMALTNFAGSGSEAFGGWLFEATKASYGRETAFTLVVAVSVAAAMSCWLLVPVLRRAAPQWWD